MTPIPQIPILTGPLADALRSKRFIIALASLIVAVIVALVPDLGEVRDELLTIIGVLGASLIGGYTIADGAREARLKAQEPPRTPQEELREVFTTLLDEYFGKTTVAKVQTVASEPGKPFRMYIDDDLYETKDGGVTFVRINPLISDKL